MGSMNDVFLKSWMICDEDWKPMFERSYITRSDAIKNAEYEGLQSYVLLTRDVVELMRAPEGSLKGMLSKDLYEKYRRGEG